MENVQLTPAEQKQVDDFAQSIDIHNSAIILQYGAGAQAKMGSFSETALNGVRSKDMGEIGGMLTGLVTQIKSFDVSEEKGGGFLGLFKKGSNKVTALKAKYTSAEKNVEQIANALESHQITLLKDITLLDKMYDQNLIYFKELTMYILAGKQKLKDVEANELPALRTKAQQSGLPEDAQAANDLANQIDRKSNEAQNARLLEQNSVSAARIKRMIRNFQQRRSEAKCKHKPTNQSDHQGKGDETKQRPKNDTDQPIRPFRFRSKKSLDHDTPGDDIGRQGQSHVAHKGKNGLIAERQPKSEVCAGTFIDKPSVRHGRPI